MLSEANLLNDTLKAIDSNLDRIATALEKMAGKSE
jgi:hypothetical protein